MTEPTRALTTAALAPQAFAGRHAAVLRHGQQAAAHRRMRLDPPRLPELVGWLPQLTLEARLDPLYPRERRTLQAAGAWITDAVLAHEDRTAAEAARAQAATLARARLVDALAQPHELPLVAMVRRLATALALALDADTDPAPRHDALIAAHAELLALAVVRRRALPRPDASGAPVAPAARAERPAPWTLRSAARHALRNASPARYERLVRPCAKAVAELPEQPPRSDLAHLIAALPELTLDALWLERGGGKLDRRAEQQWLAHAVGHAVAAMWRAQQIRAPRAPLSPYELTLTRQQLEYVADAPVELNPVVDSTRHCAECLAEALLAGSDDRAGFLGVAVAELFAKALLAQAALHQCLPPQLRARRAVLSRPVRRRP